MLVSLTVTLIWGILNENLQRFQFIANMLDIEILLGKMKYYP